MGINTDTFWVIANPIGYHIPKLKNLFGYQKLVPQKNSNQEKKGT